MWSKDHFNGLAGGYDESVSQSSQGYPFEGYYEVLGFVQNLIQEPQGATILDLGIGTGLLTAELYKLGAEVVGVDFSEQMLEKAREKMPQATFYCWDFSQGLPAELHGVKFDYIISSYALHHLPDRGKVTLLQQLQNYLSEKGKILIADIAFPTLEERESYRLQAGNEWDDQEYYIAADEFLPLLDGTEWEVQFTQISPCAGVLQIGRD